MKLGSTQIDKSTRADNSTIAIAMLMHLVDIEKAGATVESDKSVKSSETFLGFRCDKYQDPQIYYFSIYLYRGSDFNAIRNYDKRSAIVLACSGGFIETVIPLFNRGADNNLSACIVAASDIVIN